jgi:hypothetical protein
VSEDELRLNTLLAHLPADEFTQLAPRLELVDMRVRDELYRYQEPMSAVYFPMTAIVSMVTQAEGRTAPVEVGTVGFEGMVGLPLFLGARPAPRLRSARSPATPPGCRPPASGSSSSRTVSCTRSCTATPMP